MDAHVAALVLLAAMLHAGWNALVKLNGDRLAAGALVTGASALFAAAALPFVPTPAPASWPYLLTSMVVHVGYFLMLLEAYRYGDLGQVYPIARGGAPLLVLLLAHLIAGEAMTTGNVLAVSVVAVGILSLAFRGRLPLRERPQPVLYALGTAGSIGVYTLVDGMGARLAGSPHGYAAWTFILNGLALPGLALLLRRGALFGLLRRSWLPGVAGGAMSLAAYWLVIWAMTLAPLAMVAALRETSVIFAALFGTWFLGERFGGWRIASAVVVACGVVLLRL